RIQQWSEIGDGQPLFETILAFENYPVDPSLMAPQRDLTIEEVRSTDRTSYPLTIAVEPDDELSIAMIYDSRRFEGPAIKRMLGHFQALIESVAKNPEQRIGDLSLLSQAEAAELLFQWNDTSVEYNCLKPINAIFEKCAALRRDSVAAVFGPKQITYGTLNRKANQLARYLRTRGQQPDATVGLYLERSADMVIGMLGALKAGAAYLPLDVEYPAHRLASIINHAGMTILVTTRHLQRNLRYGAWESVLLDADSQIIEAQPDDNPSSFVDSEMLAYAIYTSGSTGQPKGISIPHRAVNRLVLNTNYVQLGPSDRVLQASNSSFDAATFEIWGPLLNGGCVVHIAKKDILSPRSVAVVLREQQITAMFLTTALFNQVAREMPDAFSPVGAVLFGGEQVDPKWPRLVIDKGGPRRLLHVYGPTETTTFSTWSPVEDVYGNGVVPIGKPISNTTAYVLTADLNLVPIGTTGELYIGGPGLARGYLCRPDLTSEMFVPDPFSESGARLYRTGDLVRRGNDGSIEFVGRIDNQLKLRGFRIEPGEIEVVLRGHELVRDAVVVADGASGGDKRLIAYFVTDGNESISARDLYHFLEARLPKFMMPAAFERLEALPLSRNGKVDRSQLPSPSHGGLTAGKEHVAPRDEVEEALARIWTRLLKIEKISVHDHFFELGGHSLLATQIVSQINDTFRVNFPLQAFFKASSISEVSEAITEAETSPGKTERIARLLNEIDRMPDEEVEQLLDVRERARRN
ncbi:MAG TPA: amino acid adenylation domain-containing protein, partial [Blastocatellia bacterium]|nr:amino acid adenylation domain-containing protein [Blastocatellia bacterium]